MLRAIDKWLPGYVAAVVRRPRPAPGLRHLCVCIADHFEPFRDGTPAAEARALVRAWAADYARCVAGLRDADGRVPVHTFFYPAEDDDPACLDALLPLCRAGLGEVEIHLHHRHDTADGLRAKLVAFRDALHQRHGLLGTDAAGAVRYGFAHGNWALCNSRPDGDWCGVNDELTVLRDTGCYADFTFPSAPSPTQPRTVNALYYARDRDGRPRGHDRGEPARAGVPRPAGDPALLLVQGPLALNWRRRKWGLLPRVENAELSGANPPSPARADLWAAQQIHVTGRPDWVFVKLHTHGCVPANRAHLLGDAMTATHRHLQSHYNDGRAWQLHYVSARELANRITALAAGTDANWRDHAIARPPCRA